MDTPFDVLQVAPGADDDEVEQAYRRRVMETHPDQGGSAEQLQAVIDAYERIQAGYTPADPTPAPRRTKTNGTDPATDDASAAADAAERRREICRVEYLNYEVLDDHGWSLTDDDLFEKAAAADLSESDYGKLAAERREHVLEAAEKGGYDWPYSCRGGACANCAIAVVSGEVEMPSDHILPDEWLEQGIRLSCICRPVSDELQVVYNVKHLPGLEELHLPPRQYPTARSGD